MQNIAWIDGVYSDLSEAKIPIEDRGYLLGDGVYEVIRVYNGQPFYLDAHLQRLHRSAEAIRMNLPLSIEQVKKTVLELVGKSGCSEGYIYMQLTRGRASRDHLFPADTVPSLVMYVRELNPIPEISAVEPQISITLPDERWLKCYIKTINLLPNLLARQKASEAGAVEAFLYRQGGIVTEGTRSNVFAVIDSKVRTHPATNLILAGITRGIVIDIIQELSLPFLEKPFNLQELETAEEIWVTSTTMEVNPIKAVDSKLLKSPAPGPVCKQLMEAFRNKIAANCLEDVK